MKLKEINLAAKPFVNEQPVLRTSLLLWILGLALLVLNVTLYYRHIAGKSEQREMLREVEQRLGEETEAVDRLGVELQALDLERQNAQVEFLNSQIAQRVFSWSSLFDRLAEVVPAEVQLEGISPRIRNSDTVDRRSRLTGGPPEMVEVDLQGTSRTPEAVLELVDGLFAHPSFLDPNLSRESLADDRRASFVLTVLYLPSVGDREVGIEAPEGTQSSAVEAGAGPESLASDLESTEDGL
jgi:Tfp pilus assembly protein PilN